MYLTIHNIILFNPHNLSSYYNPHVSDQNQRLKFLKAKGRIPT